MEMDGGGKGVNLFYFFDPSLAINGERSKSNCTRHSWPANHGSFCNIAPANVQQHLVLREADTTI